MLEQLTESEAEKLILSLLSAAKKPLTTREIEQTVQGKGKQCPDSAVRFLSKMRYKGVISGELSMEKKGWFWWIEKNEEGEEKGEEGEVGEEKDEVE